MAPNKQLSQLLMGLSVVAVVLAAVGTVGGFHVSLVGAFLCYDTVREFLFRSFVLARSFSNALSFLLLGVAIESMIYFFAGYFLTRIPRETFDAFLYRVLGFLPG